MTLLMFPVQMGKIKDSNMNSFCFKMLGNTFLVVSIFRSFSEFCSLIRSEWFLIQSRVWIHPGCRAAVRVLKRAPWLVFELCHWRQRSCKADRRPFPKVISGQELSMVHCGGCQTGTRWVADVKESERKKRRGSVWKELFAGDAALDVGCDKNHCCSQWK